MIAAKDYSFKETYFEFNHCNITSKRILKLKSAKAKDYFYHLYYYSPSLLPIFIKEIYSDKDITSMIEYFM